MNKLIMIIYNLIEINYWKCQNFWNSFDLVKLMNACILHVL